jgi:hypothetical protein
MVLLVEAFGIKIKQERWNAVADRLFNGLMVSETERTKEIQVNNFENYNSFSSYKFLLTACHSVCLSLSALLLKYCPYVC